MEIQTTRDVIRFSVFVRQRLRFSLSLLSLHLPLSISASFLSGKKSKLSSDCSPFRNDALNMQDEREMDDYSRSLENHRYQSAEKLFLK